MPPLSRQVIPVCVPPLSVNAPELTIMSVNCVGGPTRTRLVRPSGSTRLAVFIETLIIGVALRVTALTETFRPVDCSDASAPEAVKFWTKGAGSVVVVTGTVEVVVVAFFVVVATLLVRFFAASAGGATPAIASVPSNAAAMQPRR